MGVQQVEKFAAHDSKQGRCLTLRKSPLLEPTQNCCLPQFLRELIRPETENVHGLLREFDGDLTNHGRILFWYAPRSNE